jgi:DHA1 family tetracycline resistance protein-like MFS transporter
VRDRLPLVFIVLTLAIDAIGIGLILPVMPVLLGEVSGGTLAEAALWGGVLTTAFAVMQFLFGPLVGALSDRFGRRPVLIVSLGVMAADYLVMALAGSVWVLLIGRILGGICAATYATGAAVIADVTPPERKAARFGLIGAAFGTGFILGPVLGGLLAEFGSRAPFYAAAGLAALNMLFGLIVMPETAPPGRRRFDLLRANPLGALRRIGSFTGVAGPLAIYFLYEFAMVVYPATWAYFTALRFGWSPGTIGLSLGLFGVSFALVQGGLIRIVLPRLGEARTIAFGLCTNGTMFLVLAVVSDPLLALVLVPASALGAVVVPSLQGLMSRAVPDDRQGELQGVVASARAVAMIFGPMVMTGMFHAFTREGAEVVLPGAAFLFAFLLMVACGAILVAAARSWPRAAGQAGRAKGGES